MKEKILEVLKSKAFKVSIASIIAVVIAVTALWIAGGIYATNNALAHANLTKDQVSHIRFEFECERFIPEYQVSWYQDKREVEYTVHAFTGELLEVDYD